MQLSGAYFRPVAESQQGFCHGSCSNITSFNSTSVCLIHEYDAFAVMALVQTHKQLEKWNGNSCNRITQDIYLVDIIVLQSLHSGGMVYCSVIKSSVMD